MTNNTARIAELFQNTGLADEIPNHRNRLLSFVDKAHFQHALMSVPADSLDPPFSNMREGLPRLLALPDTNSKVVVEFYSDLGWLVDRLVRAVGEASKRDGIELPYDNLDWLWRRVAFATMTYVEMETSRPVMLNLMLLKVAQIIETPNGLLALEKFVLEYGYVYQRREPRPEAAV
jgi:hypothetical protein